EGRRLAFYTPDFLVRLGDGRCLLIEAKGRVDQDVPVKARAAVEWCQAASTRSAKWDYVFVPEGVFQRFEGTTLAELARMSAPALRDLIDERKFQEDLPLFAAGGLTGLEDTVAAKKAAEVLGPKWREGLPERYAQAV